MDTLKRAQNPDGGWGYFPGKQSWLEPTVYAALVLAGEPEADRAWALLKRWQGKDGSWRPSVDVAVESFGTALCVTLAITQGSSIQKALAWGGTDGAIGADAVAKGVEWLLGTAGVESGLMNRVVARAGLVESERDLSLKGWPWKPGTSSWVEPTAHALVALKKAAVAFKSKELLARVRLGHAQLLNVRCRDGGWNYGSREALKVDLPSYPETTGLALVGLQGCPGLDAALDYAAHELTRTTSPLGRAWLTIALRLHGRKVPPVLLPPPPPDLQILALEALAAPEGNFRLLKTEVVA